MTGTNKDQNASDHNKPLVLNKRNWMYQAPHATTAAKRIRPKREFGVVRGSEIIKNVNNSNAPLSRRCTGIVIGSPNQIDRPNTSAI